MKMLILENLRTGEADCEPLIPMPGQEALIKGEHFKTEVVDSQLLALSYLDKSVDIRLDNESIKIKVIRALKLTNWVQKDAAKLVGISPRAFHYQCKRFGIRHEKWVQKGNKKPRLKLKVMRKTG